MKIAIIGNGNVGSHLYKWLSECGHEVTSYSGRRFNVADAEVLSFMDYQLIIISVPDDNIGNIAENLANVGAIVVHTSGSVDISVLAHAGIREFGVIYPMQTFSKSLNMSYGEIPLYLEASSDEVEEKLKTLANGMSKNVYMANSLQRRQLHIGAVFSCNFVNHLWTLADIYLHDCGLEFSSMIPLIHRTVDKLSVADPLDAQTGPAARHDVAVMERQMAMLQDYPEMKQIYGLLSHSIMKLCQR